MSARLRSDLLVSALVRRVAAAGGNAAILARGEAEAGAVLILCAERGVPTALLERVLRGEGEYRWSAIGPDIGESAALADYVARRRARDPDLWLIELDIPNAERFAAESIAAN